MSKLWKWFDAAEQAAIIAGDTDRQQLAKLHHRFWVHAETAPDYALLLTDQAIHLAQRLQEPCWEVFHGYWRTELLLFYMNRMADALDSAVEQVTLVQKPAYKACPVATDIYRILMDAYVFIDPISHREKILQTIHHMEDNMDMDEDTRRLVFSRRVELADAQEHYTEAIRYARELLAMSQSDAYRQTHAYRMLAHSSYRAGDLDATLNYARAMERTARIRDIKGSIAMAYAWQAYLLRRQGQEDRAQILYQQAIQQRNRLGGKAGTDFYDALCNYHETAGDYDSAIACRQQHLSNLADSGAYYDEAIGHLAYCRLLGRAGRTLTDALAAAQAHAAHLTDSGWYQKKLAQIKDGDYA